MRLEDRALKTLKKMVRAIGNYENENIDEEEHDLLIGAIEDADPEGRTLVNCQTAMNFMIQEKCQIHQNLNWEEKESGRFNEGAR